MGFLDAWLKTAQQPPAIPERGPTGSGGGASGSSNYVNYTGQLQRVTDLQREVQLMREKAAMEAGPSSEAITLTISPARNGRVVHLFKGSLVQAKAAWVVPDGVDIAEVIAQALADNRMT